jgi:hypothetical protein
MQAPVYKSVIRAHTRSALLSGTIAVVFPWAFSVVMILSGVDSGLFNTSEDFFGWFPYAMGMYLALFAIGPIIQSLHDCDLG